MKFQVLMKDPDVLQDAIDDAIDADVRKIAGLSEDEIEAVKNERSGKVRELCGKWFEYGEYLNVEIDTDAGTCTVVPRRS